MNDPKQVVALIDDDDGPIRYYEDALRDFGFDIIRKKNFPEALAFIAAPNPVPSMWIIDVMIPIEDESLFVDGAAAIRSTLMGLGAGLLLYKKLKEKIPRTPAILLTSITTPKILDLIESALINDDTCEAKLDTLPTDLVRIVKKRISQS